MPYNPGGIFSLVASYFANPGTTIRTEQHNPVFEDVGSALSQVLIRDGRAPMTGPLNMNGFPINNAVAGSTPASVATLAQSMPIGSVIDYALKTPPAGWMLCIGQVLLANTPYQTLRTLLINDGFPYGQDGSGNPFLPNAKGCVTAGYDAMGGIPANRLGGGFGSVIGVQTTIIDRSQLPNVNLIVSASGSVSVTSNFAVLAGLSTFAAQGGGATINIPSASTTVGSTGSVSVAGNTSSMNGGVTQNQIPVVQPTIVMNKIIKVSYDG